MKHIRSALENLADTDNDTVLVRTAVLQVGVEYIDLLVKALRFYGNHHATCDYEPIIGSPVECTCGWDEFQRRILWQLELIP